MQRQAVGLPANSRGIWFEEEAAQELDQSLFVCKLIQLTDQSHAQLIFLAADAIACDQEGEI